MYNLPVSQILEYVGLLEAVASGDDAALPVLVDWLTEQAETVIDLAYGLWRSDLYRMAADVRWAMEEAGRVAAGDTEYQYLLAGWREEQGRKAQHIRVGMRLYPDTPAAW